MSFADPRGVPTLRAAIARYLAQFRDFRCDAGQIIVFNSAQQAILALALLLLDPDDAVWFGGPLLSRRESGAGDGRSANRPGSGRSQMGSVWTMASVSRRVPAWCTRRPAHQYPTGVVLTESRRGELLDWAAANDAWIIEDDYDGEFRYDGPPRAPLAADGAKARVLYVGTLSKSMFVSLRLAFAVVPEELVEPLATVRTYLDGFTPPVAQLTMSMFMDEGHFATHLRAMRSVYGARRQALVDVVGELSARGWTWPQEAAGLHLLLRHDRAIHVRSVAATAGELDLTLLGGYRLSRARGEGLFLRFAGLDVPTIERGAEILVAAAARGAAS